MIATNKAPFQVPLHLAILGPFVDHHRRWWRVCLHLMLAFCEINLRIDFRFLIDFST
jgi:hypothetical protein